MQIKKYVVTVEAVNGIFQKKNVLITESNESEFDYTEDNICQRVFDSLQEAEIFKNGVSLGMILADKNHLTHW